MKPYQLRYLRTSDLDITDIESYLENQLVSPSLVLTPIYDKIEKHLPTSPHMYPIYEDDPRFQKMVVGKYLVLYVVNELPRSRDCGVSGPENVKLERPRGAGYQTPSCNEEQHTVEIHHIWHGMRNIKQLLQEESSSI